MREAKTFPKDAFCQTQTAHGHYDDQGSFWNVMGCMRGSDSEDHPGPHVAYYPYKIPNAQARFQIDLRGRSGQIFDPHGQFENLESEAGQTNLRTLFRNKISWIRSFLAILFSIQINMEIFQFITIT